MSKPAAEHLDILGKEIIAGIFVACMLDYYLREIEICMVVRCTPKMVRLRRIRPNKYGRHYEVNRYPKEMMVVENQEDITMYIMKKMSKDIDVA
jgi:hypothetical protein